MFDLVSDVPRKGQGLTNEILPGRKNFNMCKRLFRDGNVRLWRLFSPLERYSVISGIVRNLNWRDAFRENSSTFKRLSDCASISP